MAAESLALAGLASAAVQGRVALGPRAGARVERLGSNSDAPRVESLRPLQARCDGFDLHGAVAVAGEDRDRLEQLCRYLLRPPIAQERLALRPDGKILDAGAEPAARGGGGDVSEEDEGVQVRGVG